MSGPRSGDRFVAQQMVYNGSEGSFAQGTYSTFFSSLPSGEKQVDEARETKRRTTVRRRGRDGRRAVKRSDCDILRKSGGRRPASLRVDEEDRSARQSSNPRRKDDA